MAGRICMTLGGRVAEFFFDTENITTGALDDL